MRIRGGVAAIAMLSSAMANADCGMSKKFAQPDEDGATTTAIWADPAASSLLFADAMHVNTDGTRRSYRVMDFWGADDAINNLCNAMSDKCAGMGEPQMRARRLLTERARAEGWPADLLRQTRISSSIIPLRNGKPCPEVDGFLVSATALHKPGAIDKCDFSSYVDAMTVPAIVLPGRPAEGVRSWYERQNAHRGDLAVVANRDGSRIVYAVVGDIGPRREIGEGTVALAGALLGKTLEPRNYKEVRGRPPFQGQGWDVPKAYVLIFPGTRDEAAPYMTKERIDSAARAKFEAWGGTARLQQCRAVYVRN